MIAGLTDETVTNQPTLKRFSRYNQSMRSRLDPQSHVCDPEPSSSHQPETSYKIGGKLKTGFLSGNWTLRSKKEHKLRPSLQNVCSTQIGKV
ncbi:unnamed protein product [Thelazia callipaeda]|uniref:Uncharacterized protein n=1 Tax=Thelazia callipaeda TaxID=103827 RepID=A0A0N5DBV6_THECL|nr:unnamed protein product [Thelazia callipaeda]